MSGHTGLELTKWSGLEVTCEARHRREDSPAPEDERCWVTQCKEGLAWSSSNHELGKIRPKKRSWEDTAAEARADSEVTSAAGGSSSVLTERKTPYTVV